MEKIAEFFSGFGISFDTFWKAGLVLLIGTFLISIFGRFIFGKRSTLNNAVSSTFAILFIYAGVVVLKGLGSELSAFVTPLPFVTLSADTMHFFSFRSADFLEICSQVLNMIILAFLVNLADSWLPKGKNIFVWLFFRIITVLVAYILHFVVVGLLAKFVPEGIATYAPVILVAVVVLLLLTGALKILVGALLTTVNPIIGGLYTFFFANIIGKQITKAVLTTAILSGLIYALETLGVTAISIAAVVLTAYIPVLIVLIVLWYIVGRFL